MEKRAYKRKDCNINIVFNKMDGDYVFGGVNIRAVNISEGGMMLEFMSDISVGTKGIIEFTLPHTSTVITTRAIVRWNNKDIGKIGIEFLEVTKRYKEEIKRFVEL